MALSRTTPFTGLQPDGLRLGSRRVHCVLRRRTMHMECVHVASPGRRCTFWAAKQTPPRIGLGQPRGTASAILKDVLKDVHFGTPYCDVLKDVRNLI